ncbi:low-density lipoprotein receptor domain containing lost and found [Leptinotarsa decemlineata]|uniref:low-density lipoprotein receptor domain containing lost and found n=1 Tax=Leptinotarsa decemlineata TaxID=7539 RepID=UPI000C253CA2|nr:uncharacterized protein LOC111517116 [Leptinotarsa decemlineata]
MTLRHRGPGPPGVLLFFVCVLFLFVPQNAGAEKTKKYSMQSLCKNHFLQNLYRKIDGALLWSQNERNLDCIITFQTHSILQRFMLRFDFLQLDCNDHLYIYDGAHAVGTYKFDLTCKNTKQNLGAMFTRTNYVTLKYVTDAWGTDSNGFKLVITAVKDPKHSCTEFRCNLREFCIATELVCDGINHCADGSDETSTTLCQNNETGTILGLEVTWFVVVVISTLLVLLVLIVAVSICICRRGWNNANSGNGTMQQQNATYSLQQMYGSNGAMKPSSGSMTTLTATGGVGVATSVQQPGNWCHPAGPLGFRLSTPARARLYCLAK